jgi:hypothetical protein
VGAPSAAKTGASRGRSRTRHRRERLLPLLPLLPRRRAAAFLFFLLAGEPHRHTTPTPALWPVATEVRTTASLLLWLPRPSSRGGTHRCSAPPLVMPAFVPGWDEVCCRCAAFFNTCRFLGLAFPCRRCPPCVATRVRDAAPSRSRSRSRLRSRASPRKPDAPRHRAPQHVRV